MWMTTPHRIPIWIRSWKKAMDTFRYSVRIAKQRITGTSSKIPGETLEYIEGGFSGLVF
jgi:hypothetical protein